jgi:hypothetical protein
MRKATMSRPSNGAIAAIVPLLLAAGAGTTQAQAPLPIAFGQSLRVQITPSSPYYPEPPNGSPGEWYVFSGQAGQVVRITLTSDAFDAVLYLLDPGGTVVSRDDDGGGNLDALIQATLPVTGEYRIFATQAWFRRLRDYYGNYVLSLSGSGASAMAQPMAAAQPEPSAGAGGPNAYQQTVTNQLAGAAAQLRQRGWSPVSGPLGGTLNARAQQAVEVTLRAGAFLIFGACDQDCSDFDLRIYGPGGALVAEDVLPDDQPVLNFQVPVEGRYRLVAVMASCANSPCYWGAQVFASAGGTPAPGPPAKPR